MYTCNIHIKKRHCLVFSKIHLAINIILYIKIILSGSDGFSSEVYCLVGLSDFSSESYWAYVWKLKIRYRTDKVDVVTPYQISYCQGKSGGSSSESNSASSSRIQFPNKSFFQPALIIQNS